MGGPIFDPPIEGASIPSLKPKKAYPLVLPILSTEERAARERAFGERYPGRTVKVDDVGGIVSVSVSLMPCGVREELAKIHYLSANTEAVVKAFHAELVKEMPDLPGLARFNPQSGKPTESGPTLLFFAIPRTGDGLAELFPKELDDAALVARYRGTNLRWTREMTRTVVTGHGNPCLHHRGPMPCDPPGNTREIVEHPVLGERPFLKRYLLAFDRRVLVTKRADEVELRKIATPEIDTSTLGRDLFGSEDRIQGRNDVLFTGPKTRDAVTGDAIRDELVHE